MKNYLSTLPLALMVGLVLSFVLQKSDVDFVIISSLITNAFIFPLPNSWTERIKKRSMTLYN